MNVLTKFGIEKIDDFCWRMRKKGSMLVDCLIFASQDLILNAIEREALEQLVNVAHLPGIVKSALAMPDIHWGYGFPIGAVAATDVDKGGVISPGGVGFDINCGVRLIRSDLELKDVGDRMDKLISVLYSMVPAGLGSEAKFSLSKKQIDHLLREGAGWVVSQGWGVAEDLEFCEEGGCMFDADLSVVSKRAYERGKEQLGTLGSGNHFLEVQVVDEIFNGNLARYFGIFRGQVTIMLHSGSRGFGHQVCSDFVKVMLTAMRKYDISVPDKQLACAPFYSQEGQHYWQAMCAAANYAWANRQMMTHLIRESFEKVFESSWRNLGLKLVYDVAHNIAKLERHKVDGKYRTLCVHRKGATRAFGPGIEGLPQGYKAVGQPVIIPGDMGRCSYLLVGSSKAMEETFGSSCHGAGRLKSRRKAVKEIDYNRLVEGLSAKGIVVLAHGRRTLVEEAPEVYKDVSDVVDVMDRAGIAKKVARMRSLGVIKG